MLLSFLTIICLLSLGEVLKQEMKLYCTVGLGMVVLLQHSTGSSLTVFITEQLDVKHQLGISKLWEMAAFNL